VRFEMQRSACLRVLLLVARDAFDRTGGRSCMRTKSKPDEERGERASATAVHSAMLR